MCQSRKSYVQSTLFIRSRHHQWIYRAEERTKEIPYKIENFFEKCIRPESARALKTVHDLRTHKTIDNFELLCGKFFLFLLDPLDREKFLHFFRRQKNPENVQRLIPEKVMYIPRYLAVADHFESI